MKDRIKESSFGVVPLIIREKKPLVFMVQHHEGHWVFPKGRKEKGETNLQTAARELFEESGLQVKKWLNGGPFCEKYRFTRGSRLIEKEVLYYPALVTGNIRLQEQEIKDGAFFSLEDAYKRATFCEMKAVIMEVRDFLSKTALI